MTPKKTPKRGPKPETLSITGDWEAAVSHALKAPPPPPSAPKAKSSTGMMISEASGKKSRADAMPPKASPAPKKKNGK